MLMDEMTLEEALELHAIGFQITLRAGQVAEIKEREDQPC